MKGEREARDERKGRKRKVPSKANLQMKMRLGDHSMGKETAMYPLRKPLV